MASQYDAIKNAEDLLVYIRMHGLSTAQEDLNRAADIIGHTAVGELDRLANDIGRNNEHGEPDPKGSWSSSRPATQNLLYSLLTHIWNWQEVASFWNLHTNPEHEQLQQAKQQAKADAESYMSRIKELEGQNDDSQNAIREAEDATRQKEAKLRGANAEIEQLKKEASAKDLEIIQLKAKLYDLMVGKEEK